MFFLLRWILYPFKLGFNTWFYFIRLLFTVLSYVLKGLVFISILSFVFIAPILLFYSQKPEKEYNPLYKNDEDFEKKEKSKQASKLDSKSKSKFQSLPLSIWDKFKLSSSISLSHLNSEYTYADILLNSLKIAKSFYEMKDNSNEQVCGFWCSRSKEFSCTYIAVLMSQFVSVVFHENSQHDDLLRIISETSMKWIVVNQENIEKIIKAHKELGNRSKLQIIIVIENDLSEKRDNLEVYSINNFISMGQYQSDEIVIEGLKDIKSSNYAVYIVPTSKSDNITKLTHGQIFEIANQFSNITIRNKNHPLTLYHNREFEIVYSSIHSLSSVEEQALALWIPCIERVNVRFISEVNELFDYPPSIVQFNRKTWEKLQTLAKDKISNLNQIQKKLFTWAQNVCFLSNDILKIHGHDLTIFMELKYNVALFIIKKFKQEIGFHKYFSAICINDQLSNELLEFFSRLDITIQEVFQVPKLGIVSTNRLGRIQYGTFGTPSYKITLNENSIYIHKESLPIFIQNDLDDKIKIDVVGKLNDEGFLCIEGDISERESLRNGKKFFPRQIENMWRESNDVIQDVVVIGENLNFPISIVSINSKNAKEYLKNNGENEFEDKSSAIEKLILNVLENVNQKLSSHLKVKKFIISTSSFDEFINKNGSIDRELIKKRFSKEIKQCDEKY